MLRFGFDGLGFDFVLISLHYNTKLRESQAYRALCGEQRRGNVMEWVFGR